MSGIFKGDSIYKSGGGGGGGYKDGGQLVDGDFIKVENNTISSYDNVSRNPVNFYFEVKDGEVLNSVVELTTAVNSTINVYVVRNGFYYLLGNIGGNTVNAGDDYKVNITGDSYAIEQVSAPPTPEYALIDGNQYKVLKVGSVLWTCSDLKGTSFRNAERSGVYYYEPNPNIIINGWRLPKQNDIGNLNNTYNWAQLRSTTGWYTGYNGTNESGFDAKANGTFRTDHVEMRTYNSYMLYVNSNNVCSGAFMTTDYNGYAMGGGYWCPVRLVYDL